MRHGDMKLFPFLAAKSSPFPVLQKIPPGLDRGLASGQDYAANRTTVCHGQRKSGLEAV